jgi:copper chaperone CopZ
MTHTYQITGMTCGGCQNKVQTLLSQIKDVQKVDISLAEGTADITMAQHIPTTALQNALKDYPKYQLNFHKRFKKFILAVFNDQFYQTK